MEPGGSYVCPQEKPLLVILKLFLLVNSWKYLYLWYVNICHIFFNLEMNSCQHGYSKYKSSHKFGDVL